MKHKVKVTVIDKKLYPELQKQYCADPESGMCPCYNVGDEFTTLLVSVWLPCRTRRRLRRSGGWEMGQKDSGSELTYTFF